MKSNVVKQVNVVLEKDEAELIKKVIVLINDLMNESFKNGCDGYYEIGNISRDTGELEDLVEFLKDLAYTDVIELV
jgi:hypothetical protein